MKVEYINPFIESIYELFSKALGAKAKRGDVSLVKERGQPRDITAIIGLSGPTRGIVALSFPVATVLNMVSKLVGIETRVLDSNVTDAIAEMMNMVASGAKAKYGKEEAEPIDLSLPTVVRGNSYSVYYPTKSIWLDVPFSSDLGPFNLRITFEMNNINENESDNVDSYCS